MRQGRSVVSVAELAIFLWALYIGTVFALLLDRWFEALRGGRGRVPVLEPAWNWLKGWVERAMGTRRGK